jgi:hypothetical protein
MIANHNYMIGLCSYTYDTDGDLMIAPLYEDTSIRGMERRLSRVKTLDGGCVITDGGLTASDRSFTLVFESDSVIWSALRNLAAGSWITVSTDEGCFLSKLERINEQNGKITCGIMIKSDLTN